MEEQITLCLKDPSSRVPKWQSYIKDWDEINQIAIELVID